VGVFTASEQIYADPILNFIDPENKFFQFRLYRDSCVPMSQGTFVKDLRILRNRDLKDLVIIDNSVYSFAFQLENGVPIIPYYSGNNDDELYHLVPYMHGVAQATDVRVYNRESFHLLEQAHERMQG
jgi:CTD small phosphatase-like protein 2